MKIIDDMIERIEEEVEGAKEYAEMYIQSKAKGEHTRAAKYKDMAGDELRHASYLCEFSTADVDYIKRVYTLPVDDETKWEKAHKRFHEHMAMVKQMLS